MKKFTFIFGICMVMFSCSKEDINKESSYLKINLTNDMVKNAFPLDSIEYQQLNIDLIQVRAKFGDDGWQDLPTDQGVYDLTQLMLSDTLITDTFLFDDSLKEIRLVLGNNNTIMVDSVIFDIDIPSAQSSGLKFKFDTPVIVGSTDSLTITFDADASVHQTGNGEYKLHPVIHVE